MSRRLTHAATYRRAVPASLERIWENVLDWEHLPWLHASSFSSIELIERNSDGWRARLGVRSAVSRRVVVEVRREPSRAGQPFRYVTRTLEGSGAGSEIVTRLDPLGQRVTRVEIEFHLAGVPRLVAPVIGRAYTRMYRRLWDEDEAMMVRRQAWLDGRGTRRANAGASAGAIALGPIDSLRARLPLLVQLGGETMRVCDVDGSLVAYAATCPHLGGPLEDVEVEGGTVVCPWHGYRFDARTGQPLGAKCRALPTARLVVREDGDVTLER